ncbi:hypothetical protein ACFL1P_00995 [Patescibacteria group bacterium]
MNQQQAVSQSELKDDQAGKTKTIYEVSTSEIIWRNIIAGASRAFGGIIMYILFLSVISVFLTQFILPKVMPFINSVTKMTNSVESLQNIKIPLKF